MARAPPAAERLLRSGARYLSSGVRATSANPPATSAQRTRALHSTTHTLAMPMAAIHTYQNLGINQKLTQLQTAVPRRLAPAPVDTGRKKKSYMHQQYPSQPASVVRRNARERNRVKQVNNGFAQLRQHIPSAVTAALAGGRGSSRKLSKVDTLRLAVEYIRSLKRLLEENEEGCTESQMSLGLAPSGPQTPPSSEESHSPAPSLVSQSSPGPNCQDVYDSYEPMSPEDEELLDVISWWQQQ